MPGIQPIQFVVTATGPTGVFWLSQPSTNGVRTLVGRDEAEVFPTIEAAERAIQEMPEGYKLARISFAIELPGQPAGAPRSDHAVRQVSDETTGAADAPKVPSHQPETIAGSAGETLSDVAAGDPRTRRKWWAALARLWQR